MKPLLDIAAITIILGAGLFLALSIAVIAIDGEPPEPVLFCRGLILVALVWAVLHAVGIS